MLYYITLFLIFWALIYTAARFLQYFRIVDVLLAYEAGGEERSSEVVVPRDQAAQYQAGNKVRIRYYVEENGTVHIASAGDAPRRLMYAYLAAIVLEIVVYAVVWRILL